MVIGVYTNNQNNGSTMDILSRRMMTERTPDLFELTNYPFVILMVYDNFMKGQPENRFLDGCPYLGCCTTVTEKYRMDLRGDLPIVFDERRGFYAGAIRGEAYLVTVPLLMKIDSMMANTVKFQRRKVMVNLSDQNSRQGPIFPAKAFMYIGVDHMWKHVPMITQHRYSEYGVEIYEW